MTTPDRQDAAAALLAALREVAEANDRLQLAAAWALEAFGDSIDAETVRMLRIPGGVERPGRPPVPPASPRSVTGDETCWCGHLELDHSATACHVETCQCGGYEDDGIRR